MILYKYLLITILIWNNLCSIDTDKSNIVQLSNQKKLKVITVKQNINSSMKQVSINIYTRSPYENDFKTYDNIPGQLDEITDLIHMRFKAVNMDYTKEIIKEKLEQYIKLFTIIDHTILCGIRFNNNDACILNTDIFSAEFSKIDAKNLEYDNKDLKNTGEEKKDLIKYTLNTYNLSPITIVIFNNQLNPINNKFSNTKDIAFHLDVNKNESNDDPDFDMPYAQYSDKSYFWLAEVATKNSSLLAIDLITNKSKFIYLWNYNNDLKLDIESNIFENININSDEICLRISKQELDQGRNPLKEYKLGTFKLNNRKFVKISLPTPCGMTYEKNIRTIQQLMNKSNLTNDGLFTGEIPIKRKCNTYYPQNKSVKFNQNPTYSTTDLLKNISDQLYPEISLEGKTNHIEELLGSAIFISRTLAITTAFYYTLTDSRPNGESGSQDLLFIITDKDNIQKVTSEVAWGGLDKILINDPKESGGFWSFKDYESIYKDEVKE